MDKKRVVIVCPGRGTYTRETSGYLAKYGKFRKDHPQNILDLPLRNEMNYQQF